MKTILFILFAFIITATAQNVKYYGGAIGGVFSVDLDGSTEYMSKSSPVNLDLNGANRVALDIDNDFELVSLINDPFTSDITGWTGGGGNSVPIHYSSDWNSIGRVNALRDSAIDVSIVRTSFGSLDIKGGRTYKLTYDYYVPSSNTTTNGIKARFGTNNYLTNQTVLDTWTTVSEISTPPNDAMDFRIHFTVNNATSGITVGDLIYFDNVFLTAFPSYTGTGNHSFDSTSVDPLTGSYSGMIVSSGAGDATTNYASLPAVNFTALEDGKKYTFQMQAKSVGILGSDLVSSKTWTNHGSISFETFTSSGINITSAINTTGGAGAYTGALSFTEGEVYKLTYNLTLNSGTLVGGNWYIGIGVSLSTRSNISQPVEGINTVLFTINTTGSWNLVLEGNSNFICDIAISSITLQLITPPDLTVQIGDSYKTFTAVDPSASEILVWNFEATASEVTQPIQIYLSQADDVFIDEVDLSEAYDITIMMWVNANDSTATARLYSHRVGSFGWTEIYLSGGELTAVLTANNSSSNQILISEPNFSDDWQLVTYTANRTGNVELYINGVSVANGDMTDIQVMRTTATLYLGVFAGSSNYWDGYIGETQIIRGQILTASEILTAYNRGIKGKHFLETGNEVAWDKFKGNNDTDFLSDETGNNDLTGTSVTQSDDQIKLKNYK